MEGFPDPMEGTVFYEDHLIYACLAFESKSKGHTIIACKNKTGDLSDLSIRDYYHLMFMVRYIRQVLKGVLRAESVYIMYLNEGDINVHFHLIPRTKGEEEGVALLAKIGEKLKDVSLAGRLRFALQGGW